MRYEKRERSRADISAKCIHLLLRNRSLVRIVFGFMLLLLLVPSELYGSGPSKSWQGKYRYEFVGDKTVSGTVPVVTYTLTILESSSRTSGILNIQGYQTDETLLCDLKDTGSAVAVMFRSYKGGKVTNEFGVSQFKPGATLITFQLIRSGDQTILSTTWNELRPDEKISATGVFFRRVQSKRSR